MIFYTLYRALFYLFNHDLFSGISANEMLMIFYGGLKFDISAIVYLNSLYVLFYMLPLKPSFKFGRGYQLFLKILFLLLNGVGLALNTIDIIFYRFILRRSTYNVKDIFAHETNMWKLWGQFLWDYWYMLFLFLALMILLGWGYSRLRPKPFRFRNYICYALSSMVMLALLAGLSVAGARGGFRHSTRPITLSNAGRYVKKPDHMALVLNTPFCVIRTWGNKVYRHRDYFKNEKELAAVFDPVVRRDTSLVMKKKNVVIFILESFNREYIGALNKDLDQGHYKGYTPFLDSLIEEGWIFTNAYANGRKSIDAMPSIIASIPSLVLPYVISEYSTNHINSLASLLDKKGYETAFFHGAPNGSMGFESFANLAGFHHYFGKTEYDNDADFDGIWGIWDDKFFPFFAREMNKMKQPFFTTLFSVSSHHPFKVPKEYEGKYPEGPLPIHKCIGYTDDALRHFFSMAKKMPWYKNTLFVFSADHSTISYFKESKTNLGKFAIPILFYAPGDTSLHHKKDDRPAQQIDIMPTVLGYLNYNGDYLAFGNDLTLPERRIGVINTIEGNYQYIRDDHVLYFDGEKVTGFFNYRKDHYLKNDLRDSVDYSRYEQEVKAIIQQYDNRMLEDRLLPETDTSSFHTP
jgi:phosphoglycerol transferase MdoB-like AlkP superfamily enzyme